MNIQNRIYELGNRLGRSFFEKENNSQIYSALCSVTKAAEHAYESHFLKQEDNSDLPEGYKLLYYYEPVVIFDGEIFEAFLNSSNEIEVQESNYIQVSFNYLSPCYKNRKLGYIVHIVQSSHLQDFLDNRKKCFSKVAEEIQKIEMPHLKFT